MLAHQEGRHSLCTSSVCSTGWRDKSLAALQALLSHIAFFFTGCQTLLAALRTWELQVFTPFTTTASKQLAPFHKPELSHVAYPSPLQPKTQPYIKTQVTVKLHIPLHDKHERQVRSITILLPHWNTQWRPLKVHKEQGFNKTVSPSGTISPLLWQWVMNIWSHWRNFLCNGLYYLSLCWLTETINVDLYQYIRIVTLCVLYS